MSQARRCYISLTLVCWFISVVFGFLVLFHEVPVVVLRYVSEQNMIIKMMIYWAQQ